MAEREFERKKKRQEVNVYFVNREVRVFRITHLDHRCIVEKS